MKIAVEFCTKKFETKFESSTFKFYKAGMVCE